MSEAWSLYSNKLVCTHIYIHIHTYIYIHVYLSLTERSLYTYTHIYTYMYIYVMYTYTCSCINSTRAAKEADRRPPLQSTWLCPVRHLRAPGMQRQSEFGGFVANSLANRSYWEYVCLASYFSLQLAWSRTLGFNWCAERCRGGI